MIIVSTFDEYLSLKKKRRENTPYRFAFENWSKQENYEAQQKFTDLNKYCGCEVGAASLYITLFLVTGYLLFFISLKNLQPIHGLYFLGLPLGMAFVGKISALLVNKIRFFVLTHQIKTI